MKLRSLKVVTIVVIMICSFLGSMIPTKANEMSKRILFISSYHPNFESLPYQMDGVQEIVDDYNYDIDYEFMDYRHYPIDENVERFYQSLKEKLSYGTSYDGIIVGDDAALHFAMDHQDELFYQLPIVFLGINDLDYASECATNPYVTGVEETSALQDNIDIACQLFPEATSIVAIVDNTDTGNGDMTQFYRQQENFPDLKFDVINTSLLSLEDIESQVASLNKDTILFYMTMFEDGEGNSYTIKESARILSSFSPVPIFRAGSATIGSGMVGGKMVDYKESGRLAMTALAHHLQGQEDVGDVAVIDTPHRYIFDQSVLDQYDLSVDFIDDDVTLVNQKHSFFEEYESVIVPFLVILSLLIIVIIILVYTNLRHMKMMKEINEKNKDLVAKDQQIEGMVNFDFLTNLPNKHVLNRSIQSLIKEGQQFSLLAFDIDNFKRINDNYGHFQGDRVLIELAGRMKSLNDHHFEVFHFSADEFVIVIKSDDMDLVERYIQRVFETLKKPFQASHRSFFIQISLGVASYPKDGTTLSELLANSDAALHSVKQQGKNGYVYYHSYISKELRNQNLVEEALHDCISHDGFKIVYQPRIEVKTGKVESLEALLRMKNYKISPNDFIPVAEDTGMIVRIGRIVTEKVIEMLAYLNQSGIETKISINYSSTQLRDQGYVDFMVGLLEKHHVKPSQIEIEITERVFLEENAYSTKFLQALNENQIAIALDDFGTGYSSMIYLTYMKINNIKIDKSLTEHLLEYGKVDTFQSLIQFGHTLDYVVTAEGVEHKKQFEQLRQSGCDFIQGYLFSKPLDLKQHLDIFEKDFIKELED